LEVQLASQASPSLSWSSLLISPAPCCMQYSKHACALEPSGKSAQFKVSPEHEQIPGIEPDGAFVGSIKITVAVGDNVSSGGDVAGFVNVGRMYCVDVKTISVV